MKISVIGAGSWGTTLALLLFSNKHDVTVWSFRNQDAENILTKRENTVFLPGIIIPNEIQITTDIEKAILKSELIVTAVPSQHLRSVLKQISHTSFKQSIIVNLAKGIEVGTLQTMSEVIAESLPDHPLSMTAMLSGPSFADEVSRKIPTAVVAASSSPETAKLVQQVFKNSYFRVYTSDDVRGVEFGGALKNVIAVGAGLCDGAGYGDNTKAAIMTRGIVEIARLGTALGANQKTFSGLSGIGDLIVTCMSKHSRNRHVGEEVGKGRKLQDVLSEMQMVAEGVATTKSACELARKVNVEVPIMQEVHNVLFSGKDPHDATLDLMMRDPKNEAG
ncbi:MAG: NAD(P)H-dependent glycerol-3-phosphate dehydrogenase [Bacteroidota bacterium]|nr:NAD(P)H-dependent glycerol-3-phosphate dehydrogenase [Bacteroidota bacterium]